MNNNKNSNNKIFDSKAFKYAITLLLVIGAFAAIFTVAKKPKTPVNPNLKAFSITVAPVDASSGKKFELETVTATLGDALVDSGLIEYDELEFGRFITGIKDFENIDGKYWMIYVNGEMASSGMDEIVIEKGDSYKLSQE